MLGAFDSIGQIFAALAAGLGAVAFWLFRLWQGAKERESTARFEADMQREILNSERASRDVAEKAQKQAAAKEEEAVEEVRKGHRDHFTKQ